MKKRILALFLSASMLGISIPAQAAQPEDDIVIIDAEREDADENDITIEDEVTDVIVEDGGDEATDTVDEDSVNPAEEASVVTVSEPEQTNVSYDAYYSDEWLSERGLTRNSEGLFEYVDVNGDLWTYDPEDPEFYKYFVDTQRQTVDLSDSFGDYNIYIEQEGNNSYPYVCPLTGLKYSYPSYYKKAGVGENTKVRYGLDVSKYQGNISPDSWKSMKADFGVDFAFIRAGFRGYGSSGSLNSDATFTENVKNAYKAGVKVGVYFFSQAITEDEAYGDKSSPCFNANYDRL